MGINLGENGCSGDSSWIAGAEDLSNEFQSCQRKFDHSSFQKHFLDLGYSEALIKEYVGYLSELAEASAPSRLA